MSLTTTAPRRQKVLKAKARNLVNVLGSQGPAADKVSVEARAVAKVAVKEGANKMVAKPHLLLQHLGKSLKMPSMSWRICSNEPPGWVGRACRD